MTIVIIMMIGSGWYVLTVDVAKCLPYYFIISILKIDKTGFEIFGICVIRYRTFIANIILQRIYDYIICVYFYQRKVYDFKVVIKECLVCLSDQVEVKEGFEK